MVDRRFLMYTLCIVLYIHTVHTIVLLHGKVFVDGTLKSVHRPGYYILKSVCRRGIKKQKSACRWKIEKRLPMEKLGKNVMFLCSTKSVRRRATT